MIRRNLLAAFVLVFCATVLQAQQNKPASPAPSPAKTPTPTRCAIKSPTETSTPKAVKHHVYPVVQRLNGFEVLAFLRSRGADIKEVDGNFLFNLGFHTNIVAGFTLGDGQTIITRLPQAEMIYSYTVSDYYKKAAQYQTPSPFTPKAKGQNSATTVTSTSTADVAVPSTSPTTPQLTTPVAPAPNLRTTVRSPIAKRTPVPPLMQLYAKPESIAVFAENGCEFEAKFVGLDGWTGLSFLQVEGLNQTPLPEADLTKLLASQTVQLYAPMPLNQSSSQNKMKELFLQVKPIQGRLKVEKNRAGEISRMTVTAESMTPELIGGVVFNENDEAIGIIEGVNLTEARVIPISSIKQAVERVRVQAERKPQPWIGARGEALMVSTLGRLRELGWSQARAEELLAQRRGVLLTSVPFGTPAAISKLKAGDIVLGINQQEVKSLNDVSVALKLAGVNKEISVELLRPSLNSLETINVKIGEALDPTEATLMAEANARRFRSNDLLLRLGMETLLLRNSGQQNKTYPPNSRVVLDVYPDSAAARAGLKRGDIIETINGKSAMLTQPRITSEVTLTVTRNSQPLVFKLNTKEEEKK